MSRASVPTLLNLDRAAKLLNLSPVHFSGAYGSTVWPTGNGCPDVWPQHSWQTEEMIVSREMLAEAIHDAELEITDALGYSPAPRFFTDENHAYPLRYDGVWQRHRKLHTKYGKIISAGIRGSTLIEEGVSVTYSDPDSDGWNELATITVSTEITNPKEIKIYYTDQEGDPLWEIKPVRKIEISGGVATITADSWLFIDPELWEKYPTTQGFRGINISTTDNYVTEVDVYREYVNITEHSTEFWWAHGYCEGLSGTTQNGMFLLKDADTGYVQPVPADYYVDNSYWVEVCFSPDYPPTGVRFWYYAGLQDDRYLAGRTLDPLSNYWAQAIIWLAVANIELPPCACGAAQHLFTEYRRDLAASSGRSRNLLSFDLLDNPFGTRVGAIRAWERVAKISGEGMGGFSA